MDPKSILQELWRLYSTKHVEDYFYDFLTKFHQIYAGVYDAQFVQFANGTQKEGPHLSELPDDLLPGIGQNLYALQEKSTVCVDSILLVKAGSIVRCLAVICRNFDNIPFVASCDFICDIVALSAVVAMKTLDGDVKIEATKYLHEVFYLFECLYDPYSIWRATQLGRNVKLSEMQFQPAVLHIEIIPFFYDCFRGDNTQWPTKVLLHCVHMYGALLSGAKHNATKAICPATVETLFKILPDSNHNLELKQLVLSCLIQIVQELKQAQSEQQVEVRMLMLDYHRLLENLFCTVSLKQNYSLVLHMLDRLYDMIELLDEHVLHDVLTKDNWPRALADNIGKIELPEKEIQNLMSVILRVFSILFPKVPFLKENFTYEWLSEFLKLRTSIEPELLTSLMTLVCEKDFTCKSSQHVNNAALALMLLELLPTLAIESQEWMMEALFRICSESLQSKMKVCSCGIITRIISLLKQHADLSNKTLGLLMKLLETLGRHSITPTELKQLLLLLRPDAEGKQFALTTPLIHTLSAVAKKEGYAGASHFWDFQDLKHGLTIPCIRRWPGSGFTFHCWLRLDIDSGVNESAPNFRRQLYSFYTSSGMGFEGFFLPDGTLVIAVCIKKEFLAVSVSEHPLDDGLWHCIDICHISSRRPFAQSQLTVYINGRSVTTAQLKCPSLSEPFTYCRIGSPGQKTNVRGVDEDASSSTSEKILSNLPAFFSLPTHLKAVAHDPAVKVMITGLQDKLWGVQRSLKGQISSVAVFNDVLQASQVKTLYTAGCNNLGIMLSEDSSELSDLASKLIFYYHAKASQGSTCSDLSPAAMYEAVASVPKFIASDIRDAICCIGGVPVLYPILVEAIHTETEDTWESGEPYHHSVEEEDWVVLPNSRYSDEKLQRNQVAGFLIMLRNFIQSHSAHREQLVRTNGFGIIGALLQKVTGSLIDVNVLMAVQLLVECIGTEGADKSLLHSIYQHILFDFRIWNKSDFPVRIGHIQYLSTIIKDDRKYFRKKYGTQFLLDTIRYFYSSNVNLSKEDMQTIRVSLLGLVKYYITKEFNAFELNAILGFLCTVKQESLVLELLNMLQTVLESRHCRDQVFLLLFEPGCAELLYGLLLNTTFSVQLKQKVLKVICVLLKTDRVYEKHKARLQLQEVGLAGLTSYLQGHSVSDEMVLSLLDIVLLMGKHPVYPSLLALLHFINNFNIEIKLQVSERLVDIVTERSNAVQLIGKQQSWQDSILYLLVKQPISMNQDSTLNSKSRQCRTNSRSSQINSSNDEMLESESAFVGLENLGDDASISSSPVVKNLHYTNVFEFDTQSLGTGSSKASSSEDISASVRSESVTSQSVINELVKLQAETSEPEAPKVVRTVREQEDILLHNVASVLAKVFWKGVEGSDKQAWMERGRLFTCINFLALNNELYVSHIELKRLILEFALQSAINDLNEPGQVNPSYNENARELMKWLYDFVVVDLNKDHTKKLSIELLDGVLTLLDTLLVFEDMPGGDEWTEMAHMGLGLLLSCAGADNLELCAIATPKLHALVQTRSFISLEESCYILGSVNAILMHNIRDGNQEHYSFLIPVLKALLERIGQQLITQRYLPGLPSNQPGPTFFEDFQEYSQTDEWTLFVNRQVKPMMDKYMLTILKSLPDSMNDFWNLCYEATMTGIHLRNREWGECKLLFQSQIIEPFQGKRQEESNRYQQWIMQLRSQSLMMEKTWQLLCLSLMGNCGPWKEKRANPRHWKLAQNENFSRMRLKLIPNLNFNTHAEASRFRDNLGIHRKSSHASSLPLTLAMEAKVNNMQEDSLSEEDLIGAVNLEVETQVLSNREKLVISEECELVMLMSAVKGRFEVTTNHIYFHDCSPVREDVERQDFKWSLSYVRELHLRRYNLRRSALELFLIDQTNYFLNFATKSRNKVYSRILNLRPPNLVFYPNTRSPAELLKASAITQKWVQREISNFEYLMQLNTIAGRSYNDLSQYPVFPWIVSNYLSEELDLDDPSTYRDLSKPIGVVNPKKIPEVKAKYDEFEDATGTFEKFHYGTHYSNSAGVLHYLVRMEPFTSLHIELQSGRFDVADRQFHSLPATWRMLIESTSDVKELIPEFFYLPEFLHNMNQFNLGRLQENKKLVDNVELPRWAKTPEEFIVKHRQALESEYVSSHLHEWIDLIFGYKQKGPAAVEALNVFFYCSYEGAVDLDSISTEFEREQLEKMINNFGQTPCQLLKEPHPRRLTVEEAEQRQLKEVLRPPSVLHHLDRLKAFYIEVSSENDPVTFLIIPRSQSRSFIQQSIVDNMITVNESGVVCVHGWLPYDKFIPNYFTFEKDVSLSNAKIRKKVATSFQPGLAINAKLFVVTHDGRLLLSGGHWDNSIRVYSIVRGKTTGIISGHFDVVTCLALDHFGSRLISGSRDTTCIIWDLMQQGGTSQGILPKPVQILYGHNAMITVVAIMSELDTAVSGSEDGMVNIYTIKEGIYLRTLYLSYGEISLQLTLNFLTLSDEGHVVVVAEELDGSRRTIVYVYSINGRRLAVEMYSNHVTSLLVTEDCVVTSDQKGQLMFRNLHDLTLQTVLPLNMPVTHLAATSNASHILAALKDGKLIVVGWVRKGDDHK